MRQVALRRAMPVPAWLSIVLFLFSPGKATADAVTDWNMKAAKAILATCIEPPGSNNPLHESRLYAMMHVAIHDALNAIDRRSQPYAYFTMGSPVASREAAVAAAARNVLVPEIRAIPFSPQCVQAGVASAEADYAASLALIPNGTAKTLGIQIGAASAAAIVARRAGDGSDTPLQDFAYPQGTAPGEFRYVPGTNFAFAPGWGRVTPFVLTHGAQFRSNPPFKVNSRNYATDYNELKAFGGDGVATRSLRTRDQTQIALFWIEGSPLAWNRVARSVSAERGLGLWENARLFGLLNLAMADGYIGSGETKFHYNFWRPATAVHNAASDGNPATVGDPSWTPLQANYPTPDYDSAHSVVGASAAQVLRDFFGVDNIRFSMCSYTLPAGSRCGDPSPILRTYSSFTQAELENAVSRILAGLHFRDAINKGVEHGRKIGSRAVNLFLRVER